MIVTGRGKNAIEDHFDAVLELEQMLEERGKDGALGRGARDLGADPTSPTSGRSRPLGLGHAVLQARDLVGGEPFAVMLGDDIVDAEEPCIGQMIRLFERRGNPVIALQEVPREETRQYGIVAGEPRRGPGGRDPGHGGKALARRRRPRTSRSSDATCSRRRSSTCSRTRAPTSAGRSSSPRP